MKALIDKLKRIRKLNYLENKYHNQYAFVGIGNHSINNLYPILNYLNIKLKYIVSQSEQTAKKINENYSDVIGTNDLDLVLNDADISGVFISANPSSHFELIKQVLRKHKNVFIEKPPCFTKAELLELIDEEQKSKAFVLVGMQKRYAPLYNILKSKTKNANYYTLKYYTGFYPEGDSLLDLFIHPLDIANYLFGAGEVLSLQKLKNTKADETILIHLKHKNGVVGSIELTTDYWWARAKESFFVNTDKEYLESLNTESLISTNKPKKLANIPLEKVKKATIAKTILYEQNNFLPVQEHNQLFAAGYFNEMKTFLDLCESKKNTNLSDLKSLVNTYDLIEKIKNN